MKKKKKDLSTSVSCGEDGEEAPMVVEPPKHDDEDDLSAPVVANPTTAVADSAQQQGIMAAQAPTAVEPRPIASGVSGMAVMGALSSRQLKSLTVVLAGPMKGQPYRSADFATPIRQILGGMNEILAFGPLNKNYEWHLTLKTESAKQRMLAKEKLTVKDSCTFTIRSLVSPVTPVRVHWAPFYLPAQAITQQLSRHGTITSVSWEKRSKEEGFGAVATGVRVFYMTGIKPTEMPHLISVGSGDGDAGESYELLVTIAGRKPLCLRCRRVGHVRKDCATPYCRQHGEYGHSTESCTGVKSSYSRAVKPRTAPVNNDDVTGEASYTAAEQTATSPAVTNDTPVTSVPVKDGPRRETTTPVASTSKADNHPPQGGVSDNSPRASTSRVSSENQESVANAFNRNAEWPLPGDSAPPIRPSPTNVDSSDSESWQKQKTSSRRRKRRKSRSPTINHFSALVIDESAYSDGSSVENMS